MKDQQIVILMCSALVFSCFFKLEAADTLRPTGTSNKVSTMTWEWVGKKEAFGLTYVGDDQAGCNRLERYDLVGGKRAQQPAATLWRYCGARYSTMGSYYIPGEQWCVGAETDISAQELIFVVVARHHGSTSLTVQLYAIPPTSSLAEGDASPKPIGEFKKKVSSQATFVQHIEMEALGSQLLIFLDRPGRSLTICLRFDLETKEWTEVRPFGEKVDVDHWLPGLMR